MYSCYGSQEQRNHGHTSGYPGIPDSKGIFKGGRPVQHQERPKQVQILWRRVSDLTPNKQDKGITRLRT